MCYSVLVCPVALSFCSRFSFHSSIFTHSLWLYFSWSWVEQRKKEGERAILIHSFYGFTVLGTIVKVGYANGKGVITGRKSLLVLEAWSRKCLVSRTTVVSVKRPQMTWCAEEWVTSIVRDTVGTHTFSIYLGVRGSRSRKVCQEIVLHILQLFYRIPWGPWARQDI